MISTIRTIGTIGGAQSEARGQRGTPLVFLNLSRWRKKVR